MHRWSDLPPAPLKVKTVCLACRRDGDVNAAERANASVSDAADDTLGSTFTPAAAAGAVATSTRPRYPT